jgi:TldD protein
MGLELFNTKGSTPEDIGKEAGSHAKEQLKAGACPAGKFRALIENELVGVLAHESFGHLSEGDFVVVGESPLTGKIGTRLGTDQATIVDYGTPNIPESGGLWVPYDDQGTRSNETTILDKGMLKRYLHNRGTAHYLKQEPTGNCRAVHFGFIPIPRMTNTYFTPGELTKEEALELLIFYLKRYEVTGCKRVESKSLSAKCLYLATFLIYYPKLKAQPKICVYLQDTSGVVGKAANSDCHVD